ncbi:hypothetical protein QUF58_10190 [Anaerolineales bacterium HSG24]|nr:hypothetical protein [Anaerolineales bacterium HSG24]
MRNLDIFVGQGGTDSGQVNQQWLNRNRNATQTIYLPLIIHQKK